MYTYLHPNKLVVTDYIKTLPEVLHLFYAPDGKGKISIGLSGNGLLPYTIEGKRFKFPILFDYKNRTKLYNIYSQQLNNDDVKISDKPIPITVYTLGKPINNNIIDFIKVQKIAKLIAATFVFETSRKLSIEYKSDIGKVVSRYGRDESVKQILSILSPKLSEKELEFYSLCITRLRIENLDLQKFIRSGLLRTELKNKIVEKIHKKHPNMINDKQKEILLKLLVDIAIEKTKIF